MTAKPGPLFSSLRAAPNLLTLVRICLAPFLVTAILESRFRLSLGLFLAAGLTDALDGALARFLKQRTMLGEYLDPVADKLLLSTLFLVLTHMGLIPMRVTVLVWQRFSTQPRVDASSARVGLARRIRWCRSWRWPRSCFTN
jgi:cardiolipin synthase